jgi:hypothetical protein
MSKKTLLVIGFIFSTMAAVWAQDQQPPTTPPPTPPNPNAPEVKFEKDMHDFGTLQKGATCEVEFKFTNTGKEPLVISNASASCGCTVPSYPKEPIMPGKSGVIKVKYDSNRVGTFTKEVTVTSNARNNNVKLTIKGKIEAPPKEEQFPGNNNVTGAPIPK